MGPDEDENNTGDGNNSQEEEYEDELDDGIYEIMQGED